MMIRLRMALLAAAAALPISATAQQMDHSMPMPGMEAAPKKKATPRTRPTGSPQAGTHAGHGAQTSRRGASAGRAEAGRKRPSSAAGTAAHDMGAMGEAGSMGGMARAEREPPNPPPPARALSGPAHAADLVFAPSEMARAREELRMESGDLKAYRVLLDRLETQFQQGGAGYRWGGQAWYGGDFDKLWIKTEGSGAYSGKLEAAEVQALWSRAVTPWFDLQMGVRQDFPASGRRTHAVIGLQGLMPYMYDVEAALFISNRGEVTARFGAEYDLFITQRLILQPRVEANLSAQNIPELGIGAGLSTVEAGLRLRYQVIPEFAPYVGVDYEQKIGNTADYARDNGERAGRLRYLVGLRSWF